VKQKTGNETYHHNTNTKNGWAQNKKRTVNYTTPINNFITATHKHVHSHSRHVTKTQITKRRKKTETNFGFQKLFNIQARHLQ